MIATYIKQAGQHQGHKELTMLQVGDRVGVKNNTMSGKPITEGIATLIRFIPMRLNECRELWEVKFDGDEDTVSRLVEPQLKIRSATDEELKDLPQYTGS